MNLNPFLISPVHSPELCSTKLEESTLNHGFLGIEITTRHMYIHLVFKHQKLNLAGCAKLTRVAPSQPRLSLDSGHSRFRTMDLSTAVKEEKEKKRKNLKQLRKRTWKDRVFLSNLSKSIMKIISSSDWLERKRNWEKSKWRVWNNTMDSGLFWPTLILKSISGLCLDKLESPFVLSTCLSFYTACTP